MENIWKNCYLENIFSRKASDIYYVNLYIVAADNDESFIIAVTKSIIKCESIFLFYLTIFCKLSPYYEYINDRFLEYKRIYICYSYF